MQVCELEAVRLTRETKLSGETSPLCCIELYNINSIYVGHLESKERLPIQHVQLLHCTRSVVWCVSVECGQSPGAVRAANFSTL
jgi:hypothetical protein